MCSMKKSLCCVYLLNKYLLSISKTKHSLSLIEYSLMTQCICILYLCYKMNIFLQAKVSTMK